MRIDLERYAARLEQAQRDCKDRFRKDILFRMKDDIFNARRQFRELNKVMEQLTYGEEVYRFELEPSRDPQLAAFYQVIVDKGNQQMTEGDSLDNLAATADPAYERQVDELMEKIMADVDENTRARQEGRTPAGATLSDYVDYRTYLDYDIKVTNQSPGSRRICPVSAAIPPAARIRHPSMWPSALAFCRSTRRARTASVLCCWTKPSAR